MGKQHPRLRALVRYELIPGGSGALFALSGSPILPLNYHHRHMPLHLSHILADNSVPCALQIEPFLPVPRLLELVDLFLDV